MINRELLSAYLDGEVTSAERAEVDALLKSDPLANQELAAIRGSKTMLTSNLQPIENDELWRTCVGRLNDLDKSKRIEGFVGRYAWGLCCAFFLVILAGGMLRHMNPNGVRPGQVASYVSSLGGDWFRPSTQAEPRSELQNMVQTNQLNVVGTKRGFFDGHQVLCYRLLDSRGAIDLLVVSNVDGIDGGQRLAGTLADSVNNANFVGWQRGSYALFLLADSQQRTPQELAAIAQSLRLR